MNVFYVHSVFIFYKTIAIFENISYNVDNRFFV